MDFPTRDFEAERRERESFILLQHAYAWSHGKPDVPLSAERLAHALGLLPEELAELVRHLAVLGHLGVRGEGVHVAIRPEGIDYIERLAWRRPLRVEPV